MPPGRIASSTSSSGASRTASHDGKRAAQPRERDVAVAVVRRLREHREDQLVERLPVRRRRRAAVDEPQPVAQRAAPGGARAASSRGAGRAARAPRYAAMIETHEAELDGLPVVWRSAPGARSAGALAPRRAGLVGAVDAVPGARSAGSRPTCPASAAAPSAATSTTRSPATRTGSSASASSPGSTASGSCCTTGARSGSRSPSGRRSGSSGSSRSTSCRSCPATAGTRSRASGGRRSRARSRWA